MYVEFLTGLWLCRSSRHQLLYCVIYIIIINLTRVYVALGMYAVCTCCLYSILNILVLK